MPDQWPTVADLEGNLKRGTPRHPKVSHLRELLKISLPTAIGYLELLWHFTAEFAPQGDIGRYSDARIEAGLSWTGAKGKLVESLAVAGWLDRHPEWRLLVHDWPDHADAAVKKRLERSGLPFLRVNDEPTGQRQTTADNGPLARAPSNPDPSPEPEPEPEPIDTPAVFVKNAVFAKTAESRQGDRERLSPLDEELIQTLGLWKRAYPEGVTGAHVRSIRNLLRTTPAKAYCSHLDGMKRKFQPGGSEEPTTHGFFESTARNFAKDYESTNGNGLSKAKFDAMTEQLG
ncbi:MAG: hypothetical protein JWO19_4891 [Bryobacterales bacterium]|nr:hypothetical protein [Bryobacterales bacterium]